MFSHFFGGKSSLKDLWPAVLVFSVSATVLVGCGGAPSEPEESVTEISAPPNAQAAPPWSGEETGDLPVWAYSGLCDQPRGRPGDGGVVLTNPIAGGQDVTAYVPDVEQSLCELAGVQSASVTGMYSMQSQDMRAVEMGVVLDAQATADDVRAVRRSIADFSRDKGFSVAGAQPQQVAIYFTDGSSFTGALADVDTAGFDAGFEALEQLRQSEKGDYWSVAVGEQLELSTYVAADPARAEVVSMVQEVMKSSEQMGAASSVQPRVDRVVVKHESLTMVYTADDQQVLSGALVEDLKNLGRSGGVETVTAQMGVGQQGQQALDVEIVPVTSGAKPDVDSALEQLRSVAGLRGVQVVESIVGVPAEK